MYYKFIEPIVTDNVGRLVIPRDIRRALSMTPGTEVKICVVKDSSAVERLTPVCAICGAENPELEFKGKRICVNCLKELQEA